MGTTWERNGPPDEVAWTQTAYPLSPLLSLNPRGGGNAPAGAEGRKQQRGGDSRERTSRPPRTLAETLCVTGTPEWRRETTALQGWPRRFASPSGDLHPYEALSAQGISRIHSCRHYGHSLSDHAGFGKVHIHPTLSPKGSGGNALLLVGGVATSWD